MSQPLLLEREPQLAELDQALESLLRGNGSFVVVEGAPGLGKSRLLAQVRESPHVAGARLFTARGSELEKEYAFGVVRQMFTPVLLTQSAAAKNGAFAGSAAPASSILGAMETDQEVGDLAALNSLFWLTANLSHEMPLVLLMDDLHWADEPSLRFLHYLLSRLDEVPVLVITAVRPPGAESYSAPLRRVINNSSRKLLEISPLSVQACDKILQDSFSSPVEPGFVSACSAAAGGNPMLLKEMAAALRMRGVEPTAQNAASATALAADAVSRRVRLWLNSLPAESGDLARAVAVLGGEAPLEWAAALAGLEPASAVEAASALETADLFTFIRPSSSDSAGHFAFVHPLVRAAVYETLGWAVGHFHLDAAQVLHTAGAEPERVAAHLLRIPAEGRTWMVQVLKEAGAIALARGAADTAFHYLQHCLPGLSEGEARVDLLIKLGYVASLVDLSAASDYLEEALALCRDTQKTTEIAYLLGRVWFYSNRFEEAVNLYEDILRTSHRNSDFSLRLLSGIVQAKWLYVPVPKSELSNLLTELRRIEPQETIGSRMLDGVVASYDAAVLLDPSSVNRALRAISDGLLLQSAPADIGMVHAWFCLLEADRQEVMSSLDAVIAQAHKVGSTYALTAALTFRGLGWLWRGELTEAENDLRAAVRAGDAGQVEIARFQIGPYLAETLMELGRLEDASAALEWTQVPDPLPPAHGVWFYYLYSQSKLLRRQGLHEEALNAALESGKHLAAIDAANPAPVAWRSEAALCFHALQRPTETREYAEEELGLARRWGAPRALGHALYINGLLNVGPQEDLLREAVSILESSPARLEYAKALLALSGALRRKGARKEARSYGYEALELAKMLHAAYVINEAASELQITGMQRSRLTLSGPGALTPSERRVSELAAAGKSNREIAQEIYVTIKTVEVHLSNSYRKLGINRRDLLKKTLGP
ncbi:AAA family ATPase [Streptomyces sp. NPDC053431]|uniref:helix-turn-helix transcriptional regulator n=1 Tax=Streptomyces sp. NPDC053431 TaxID=3365703 RepID=UPI0037D41A5A